VTSTWPIRPIRRRTIREAIARERAAVLIKVEECAKLEWAFLSTGYVSLCRRFSSISEILLRAFDRTFTLELVKSKSRIMLKKTLSLSLSLASESHLRAIG